MNCIACGSTEKTVTYRGTIRNGAVGNDTTEPVEVFRCACCGCIWHNWAKSEHFYLGDEYRERMGEDTTLETFYKRHDAEVLEKLRITGTEVYRGKIFMDVGCGGGGYADFIRGVAAETLLVEPNDRFREQLAAKGYRAFAYMQDARTEYAGRIEVLTSYDVIEHVDDPLAYLREVYSLLCPGGVAYIGTPTDYPVLRGLLGTEFESFLFSVQHPWIFSGDSLRRMAKTAGFAEVELDFRQRFGMGNLIGWLQKRQAVGEARYPFISPMLDAAYKAGMAGEQNAEYIVAILKK